MMVSGRGKVAGVIGWPVSHSRSPVIHGWWLERYQIDGAYIPMAVAPDRLESALRGLAALGFRGANVTVPHKEAAAAIVDELAPAAERLGAVNTIVVKDDGRLVGSNTDGIGFIASLRQAVPGWLASEGAVVVIGAGGAGRGIVAALQQAGTPKIFLVNRSFDRAERVAREIGGGVEAVAWGEREEVLAKAEVLVNATTQGMRGHSPLELPLDRLKNSAIVADIVYVPIETPLLKAGRERGLKTVDGLGMLLHQARPGFHAWFGVWPEITTELRRLVLDRIASEAV